VLVAQLVALDLDVHEVRREVVARVRRVLADLPVEVLVERLEAGDALLGGKIDRLEHVVHEAAEDLLVLGREPEHAGDHVDRDALRVLHSCVDDGGAGFDVAHAVEQVVAQPPNLGLPRIDRFGENGGSRSRRAIWWKGGSDVMGGAGPIGAGMSGRVLLTITPRLVKWSVS
jgi:hypothetical protein